MYIDIYTAALHQLILMSRDPLIYLAIDEDSSGFNAAELMALRIAKAHALFSTFQLDGALKLALANHQQLQEMQLPSCVGLNLTVIIGIYAKLGDNFSMQSYTQEASQFVDQDSPTELVMLLKCAKAMVAHRILEKTQEYLELMIASLEKVEHPFCRTNILRCIAKSYALGHQCDLALNYLSAAYDVAAQNKISIHMLGISIEMLSVCAHLGKYETAERFYNMALGLIEQLRLPAFKVELNFSYGCMRELQEDYRSAVLFYKQSLDAIAENKLTIPIMQYRAYSKLAHSMNALGEDENALAYQLEAEKLIGDVSTPESRADLSADIAISLMGLQRWDEAIFRLKAAAQFFKKHDKTDKHIRTIRSIAQYYHKRQDYLRAFATLQKLDQLNQEYISKLLERHSKTAEHKLEEIMADTKALRSKYDKLLIEVSKRQSARFTGESKAAKRVIDSAVLAAMHHEASVLIQGESGTGKAVLAQMIHYSSPQKYHPFITVNCASISQSLFEIEFFGSAPGPLTGSTEERKGCFEQAGEGTLFLSEISELPQDFQLKLLSVLDSKAYTPVGKTQALPIRCRIISSTNQDPLEMFKSSQFRLDLLHRLNALEITVPPLRERLEDIPLLVESFARDFSRESTKRLPQIKTAFYDRLAGYEFPGNVRELRNIIERIFILYYAPVWTADILENIDAFKRDKHLRGSLIDHNIKDLDKERIIEALRKTGGKQKTAALLLGMTESTLCRKIQRYKIK